MPQPVDRATNIVPDLPGTTVGNGLDKAAEDAALANSIHVTASKDLAETALVANAELNALRDERDNANRLRDDAEREIKMLEAQAQKAVREAVNVVGNSLSYKVEDAIVVHFRKPWRLPLLPVELTRVLRARRRGGHFKMRDALADISRRPSQRLAPRDPAVSLPSDEIQACTDTKRLRQFLWEAFHRQDVVVCRTVYKRLQTLSKVTANARDQRYLEKISGALINQARDL
jgi:hypothetical protein